MTPQLAISQEPSSSNEDALDSEAKWVGLESVWRDFPLGFFQDGVVLDYDPWPICSG